MLENSLYLDGIGLGVSLLAQYLLVYDADCGSCTRFKRIVDWLDKHERLSYSSLIKADDLGLLDAVPKVKRHMSFHLISPQGIKSGSNAIPELLSLLPLGGLASFLISSAPLRGGVDFVYSTLSRLHNNGSCAYEPKPRNQSRPVQRLLTIVEIVGEIEDLTIFRFLEKLEKAAL